jgi:hypothetical protein
MVDQERIFSGPGFGVAKQWLDNTLNTSFNMNYMSNSLNGDKEGNITNLSSLISYKIKKKHRIKMIYNFIKSNSDSATTISYRESTIKLSYSYSF